MPQLIHRPVQSSSLKSVGYDGKTKSMEILLRDGGLYEHFEVPEHVYAALIAAVSKGSYYENYVKRNYARVRKA